MQYETTEEGLFAIDPSGTRFLVRGNPGSTIITIEDLTNAVEVIRQKEDKDRFSVVSFLTQDPTSLREHLVRWAGAGFPDGYFLTSLGLSPPSKCSDGISRNNVEYISYLTGKTIQDWFVELNTKVSGMNLQPSIPVDSIQIWVYKN